MFNDIKKRYLIFMLGIIFVSLGITLIVKSNLGTAPISSVPFVLTFIFPISLGTFTFIVNIFMLAGQVILLKKDFPKIQYLQIVIVLFFGMFIDIFTYLLTPVKVEGYLSQITILFVGCIIQSIGISLEVTADVLVLPGEGIVKTISNVFNKEFGTVKTIFDISMVIISIVISLLGLGKIVGLREGTLIAACMIGTMSKFIKKKLESFIEPLLSRNIDENINEAA